MGCGSSKDTTVPPTSSPPMSQPIPPASQQTTQPQVVQTIRPSDVKVDLVDTPRTATAQTAAAKPVPVASTSPAGATASGQSAATTAARSHSPEEADALRRLAELEAQTRKMQQDIAERDQEILRLRNQAPPQHSPRHILPKLESRYVPRSPPSDVKYTGPLLLNADELLGRTHASMPGGATVDDYKPIQAMAADQQATASADLRSIIVCFMLDGSDKYTPMTLRAIHSLQSSTPDIAVGVVALDVDQAWRLVQAMPRPQEIHIVGAKSHFDKWNPTQHKLDIIQFSSTYSTIFWFDSDVYVYRDIRPLLLAFHHSDKPFAFMPDLVMLQSSGFLSRWVGDRHRCFTPQASLMGFKSKHIGPLFERWELRWREWITPFPFAKYRDPMPDYSGSSFCIEQYALAMALEDVLSDIVNEIFLIGRRQVFLNTRAGLSKNEFEMHIVPFVTNDLDQLQENSAALLLLGSLGVKQFGSLGSLGSYSGRNQFGMMGSLGSYAGSLGMGSLGVVEQQTQAASQHVQAGAANAADHHASDKVPQQPIANEDNGEFMLDDVANSVLHLYNARYQPLIEWLTDHTLEVMSRLRTVAPRW
eukprot:TRINITY_DN5098_c0_g1_i1.p1 TRINITY_DN5098_c0_g1~~TRINITY_DN5098_c0_g1_i1.p1  ORF type:complete len:589 (+),score=134.84 TRINITY_DN5098_c0_g1_i1:72-1838(+)